MKAALAPLTFAHRRNGWLLATALVTSGLCFGCSPETEQKATTVVKNETGKWPALPEAADPQVLLPKDPEPQGSLAGQDSGRAKSWSGLSPTTEDDFRVFFDTRYAYVVAKTLVRDAPRNGAVLGQLDCGSEVYVVNKNHREWTAIRTRRWSRGYVLSQDLSSRPPAFGECQP